MPVTTFVAMSLNPLQEPEVVLFPYVQLDFAIPDDGNPVLLVQYSKVPV